MFRMRCGWFALLLACGGGSQKPAARTAVADDRDEPPASKISIVPVASQTWYRSASICGQGPYEIEVPVSGVKWGEEVELRLATPRRVALNAVIVGDDEEVVKTAALFDRDGRGHGKTENMRCVADRNERVAAVRAGGGGGGGTTVPDVTVGKTIIVTPPPPSVPQPLQIEDGLVPEGSIQVVRFGWREVGKRVKRIRIRLWSVEPNDLDNVRFGVVKIDWKPNVPEAEYEAHLERLRIWEEQKRLRIEEERRRQEEDARRLEEQRRQESMRLEEERRRREEAWRRAHPVDPAAERERLRNEEAERQKRIAREERDRLRRIEVAREDERRRLEEARQRERDFIESQRQREIDAALEVERRKRREAYCAAHHESRDCWGAGGKQRHDEFENRVKEREDYCLAHAEDVRCWSYEEGNRRRVVWQKRVDVATAPPKQPDGPPPAPREETPPPKLSTNAEWRPGYWQWTGVTWVWLGGMWRVPDEDIAAEQTTTAPVAPPPPRVEEIPPPPMTTTIWVAGFWQWNGKGYIWVAGSYQARPEVGAAWRPAEWRPKSTGRGAVHILIPGGWVKRGRR